MLAILLAGLFLSTTAEAGRHEADLLVGAASGAELRLTIDTSGPTGRRALTVDCVERCPKPIHYTEEIDDVPLGLFKRWDGDDLVYSVWGGGVAYRVRVWRANDEGVLKVFEQSSRWIPDFSMDHRGRQLIRTYERPQDSKGRETSLIPKPVIWRLDHNQFKRLPP